MVLIFFLLLELILVPLTFSQSELPSCAVPCFTAAVEASGCTETDYRCLCTNSVYHSVGTCCVRARCDAQDLQTVWTDSVDLCLEVGVTVTQLPAAACTSTYGVAASTAVGSATSGAVSSAITASSSSTAAGTSSGNDNNNGSSDNGTGKSGGLSTAASVGIGVGVGVVGLLLLGALVWFLIHYRKRSKLGEAQFSPTKMDDPPDPAPGLYHKGELDGSQQQKQHQSQLQPSSQTPGTIPVVKTPDDDYPTRPSTTVVSTEDSLLEDHHQYSSVSAFELQTVENLHQRQDVASDMAELSTHRRPAHPEPYELQS